jgi:hypothetical protein
MQFKAHSFLNYTITTKGLLLYKQTRASARIDHPVGRIVVYNTTRINAWHRTESDPSEPPRGSSVISDNHIHTARWQTMAGGKKPVTVATSSLHVGAIVKERKKEIFVCVSAFGGKMARRMMSPTIRQKFNHLLLWVGWNGSRVYIPAHTRTQIERKIIIGKCRKSRHLKLCYQTYKTSHNIHRFYKPAGGARATHSQIALPCTCSISIR